MIGADAGNGIRVFIPDIGMFVAGLAIWLLCRSLVQKRPPEDMAQYNTDFEAEEQVGLICGGMCLMSAFKSYSLLSYLKHLSTGQYNNEYHVKKVC